METSRYNEEILHIRRFLFYDVRVLLHKYMLLYNWWVLFWEWQKLLNKLKGNTISQKLSYCKTYFHNFTAAWIFWGQKVLRETVLCFKFCLLLACIYEWEIIVQTLFSWCAKMLIPSNISLRCRNIPKRSALSNPIHSVINVLTYKIAHIWLKWS